MKIIKFSESKPLDRSKCDHQWKQIYYGVKCIKCGLFYVDGCAPWEEVNLFARF